MENVTITFNTMLQLFGAIAVVGGGVKIIVSMFAPYREVRAELDKVKGFLAHDKDRLEKGDKRMEEIDKRLDNQDEALAVLGLAMKELINHTLTGNDAEELKKQQDNLDRFFYKGTKKGGK